MTNTTYETKEESNAKRVARYARAGYAVVLVFDRVHTSGSLAGLTVTDCLLPCVDAAAADAWVRGISERADKIGYRVENARKVLSAEWVS